LACSCSRRAAGRAIGALSDLKCERLTHFQLDPICVRQRIIIPRSCASIPSGIGGRTKSLSSLRRQPKPRV
jgi:hypothetical protein